MVVITLTLGVPYVSEDTAVPISAHWHKNNTSLHCWEAGHRGKPNVGRGQSTPPSFLDQGHVAGQLEGSSRNL